MADPIRIRGARQNNLKDVSLDIRPGEITVITGLSGSGKTSLAFDTLYAEGQRRYTETFSPYARQFLDRLERPQADAIENVPPAIAIGQANPIRTSRSTVGTMTEINDHIKLLFGRAATLFCRQCGQAVRRDTPESVARAIRESFSPEDRIALSFAAAISPSDTRESVEERFAAAGFTHVVGLSGGAHPTAEILADRFRLGAADDARLAEAVGTAMVLGSGSACVLLLDPQDRSRVLRRRRFSSRLSCPDCGIDYPDATAADFSFNSPVGACPHCKGFGRTIGIDMDLVIPNPRLSLADGAVRVWATGKSYRDCHADMLRYAKRDGIPADVPFADLPEAARRWVIEGEPGWDGHWSRQWYGVRHFFEWLETKNYKMHVRVLLSRYRSYDLCPVCRGARVRGASLLWRLGSAQDAAAAVARLENPPARWRAPDTRYDDATLAALPGLSLADVMRLPVSGARAFFESVRAASADGPARLVATEITARLSYLESVGLGYLTLGRQSRTLSGGELQRVSLTTALGSGLVNTLFVLDEPSVGLHPADLERVVRSMRALRDAGNTLVVVEHDPAVMLAADRILDMGPGHGKQGGSIVFDGAPCDLPKAQTLTAQCLSDRGGMRPHAPRPLPAERLSLRGVAFRNLHGVDISIPVGRMTVVAGVSGSGKSTLVADVLLPALGKAFAGVPVTGPFESLTGTEFLSGVESLDQEGLARNARSNPASVVGAFDAIRQLFAQQPRAAELRFRAGDFSFNAGNGRCPACQGSGYERVEMQFLPDILLQCPQCRGRRFRDELLEVRLQGKNIAEVLEMTVSEAIEFFSGHPKITKRLAPLEAVGLDYLTLGQPVPTLSGGEAQRLAIARLLANLTGRKAGPKPLLVFDEPTSGLHIADVGKLLAALDRLARTGHTILVVEHNLDVIDFADHVIDLGPGAGESGGRVVAQGTPDEVAACPESPTGRALAAHRQGFLAPAPGAIRPPEAPSRLEIRGARENNLADIDVSLPLGRFTAVTGVSGSGKSTLAFDIVFSEGQRRFLTSVSAWTRSAVQTGARPDVDSVRNIPPAVAIAQRTSAGGRKSTVATMSEIWHFLRILWTRAGVQWCPDCRVETTGATAPQIVEGISRACRGQTVRLLVTRVRDRKGLLKDEADWAARNGYQRMVVDGVECTPSTFPKLDRNKAHTVEVEVAACAVGEGENADLRIRVAQALAGGNGVFTTESGGARRVWATRRTCPKCFRSFPDPDPRLFSFNSRIGWCPSCYGTGLLLEGFDAEQTGEEARWRDVSGQAPCPDCGGARLNARARSVRLMGKAIHELAAMTVRQARAFLEGSATRDGRLARIAETPLAEVRSRLGFLEEVGLGYLTLDRASPTLSGGESQRIRLAGQLGSSMQGVCYVLDEPTIGLHPRDNEMLISTLLRLRDAGNTLLVVEHDEEMIRRADSVLDIGPGAGSRGGRIVAQGTLADIVANPDSVTGRWLAAGHGALGRPRRAITPDTRWLEVRDATLHNLKVPVARFPLGRIVAVTGVSGSGKSSLVRGVLLESLRRGAGQPPAGCREIVGAEAVSRLLEVDQTPIGKTSRSCPATYVGFWDAIRKLLAQTNPAKARGWGVSRFSFNTKDGRCPACQGQGFQTVEMSFLPDMRIVCDACGGKRFDAETLAATWKGLSAADILALEVDRAAEVFSAVPAVARPLRLMQEAGLGYLTLGQPSQTLSGGEAQRIKLVTELARVSGAESLAGTLFVFDEPTVGLHMSDVERLNALLERLAASGATLIVVEHNLDVIGRADHVLELGPDGGDAGGRLIAQGSPEQISRLATPTGAALRRHFAG